MTDRPNSALNSPALHEQYCSPNPPKQRGDFRTLANRQHPGMRLHENPIGLAPGKGSPQLSALLGGQFRRRASSRTIGEPLLSRRPGRIPPVPTRAAAEPGSAVDTVISRLRPCHLPEIATPGQAVSREAVDFGQFASVAYCPSVSGWDIAVEFTGRSGITTRMGLLPLRIARDIGSKRSWPETIKISPMTSTTGAWPGSKTF